MYISEFLCGVAATLIAEFAAAVSAALVTSHHSRKKRGKDGCENMDQEEQHLSR